MISAVSSKKLVPSHSPRAVAAAADVVVLARAFRVVVVLELTGARRCIAMRS